MHRGGREAIARDGRELTCVETIGEPLQRVPRGDLRLPAFVHETADTRVQGLPRLRAFGLEPIEAGVIDRLERQAVLKPLLRRRFELGGSPKSVLTLSIRPKALEANRTWRRARRLSQAAWARTDTLGRLPSSSPPGSVTHSPSTI